MKKFYERLWTALLFGALAGGILSFFIFQQPRTTNAQSIGRRYDMLSGVEDYQVVNCSILSTATTSTLITGCAAPAAGNRIYIKSLQWSSSIISTTTNFMTLQSGTGGSCGTGTTVVWNGFVDVVFGHVEATLNVPIALTRGHELCFLHPGAGTRNVNVQGYVGP